MNIPWSLPAILAGFSAGTAAAAVATIATQLRGNDAQAWLRPSPAARRCSAVAHAPQLLLRTNPVGVSERTWAPPLKVGAIAKVPWRRGIACCSCRWREQRVPS